MTEKEKPVPPQEPDLARVEDLYRVADELRADYDMKRDKRLSLRDLVQTNSHKFEKIRAEYYSALAENERSIYSLRDELRRVHHEIEYLRDWTDRLKHERKDLMATLERGSYIHRRKKARTDSTGGDVQRKT